MNKRFDIYFYNLCVNYRYLNAEQFAQQGFKIFGHRPHPSGHPKERGLINLACDFKSLEQSITYVSDFGGKSISRGTAQCLIRRFSMWAR